MKYFVELWNVKSAWKALPQTEKEAYMQNVAEVTQEFTKKGVKILTWSKNTTNDSQKANYDFFAIWTLPSEALETEFLTTIQKAGWYNYFDQVNLTGIQDKEVNIIQELIRK